MYRKTLPLLFATIPMTATADHLAGGFGLQSASPIWTESASTLKAGQVSFGVRSEYLKLRSFSDEKLVELRKADAAANPEFYEHHHGEEDDDSHAKQANLHGVDHLLGGSFRLAYGITDDFTVGLRIPFVYRSNITEVESGHFHDGHLAAHQIYNHGDSQGLGDMSFWGQYRFLNQDNHEAAVILGFKTPTGEVGNTGFEEQYHYTRGTRRTPAVPDDHSPRLETHLQPGTGSWDGMFGLAYAYDFDFIKFNSSLMYTLTTTGAQDTDIGDSFAYNFAASVPYSDFVPCNGCSWNFIFEVNGEWRDKEMRGDVEIGNSGGHVMYVSPGIRFIGGENWSIGGSFGYAVISDLNGDQATPDYRAMGTINFTL